MLKLDRDIIECRDPNNQCALNDEDVHQSELLTLIVFLALVVIVIIDLFESPAFLT